MPNCASMTGKPCRCQRLTVPCMVCGQKFSVSHGENAGYLTKDGPYTCIRCRARR